MGKRHDKFYVGQRVKFVAAGHKVPLGSIGTVATPAERHRPDVFGRRLTYGVIFDACPAENGHHRGWACLPCNLEPIYDGGQKVAWSECAWRPASSKIVPRRGPETGEHRKDQARAANLR